MARPNPLEAYLPTRPDDAPPGEATPTQGEMRQLLAGIRQDISNEIVAAWDKATGENGASMGEAMWALAMLQARILASAEMGNEQTWVAARFADLVQLALPAMMMAVERARRQGKPPADA